MKKWIKWIPVVILCYSLNLYAKDVVVANVKGQLGNQLFIIAATTSYALDNNLTPVFPNLETEKRWNVRKNYTTLFSNLNTSIGKKKIQHHYKQSHYHFSPIPKKRNIQIEGYFQSEKFFKKHKNHILKLFAPPSQISDYLKSHYSDIIEHPKTVAIHYRDSVNFGFSASEGFKDNSKHHPVPTLEYFKKAMEKFSSDSLFVVFSDNIPLCKELFSELAIDKNVVFIEGEDYFVDFYLMSLCKHQIISNSSFSWWAAYLNKNPSKIVVTPKVWFGDKGRNLSDLRPEGWLII